MPMGEIGDSARLDQYLPLSMVRTDLAKRFTLNEERLPHRRAGALLHGRETGGSAGLHHAAHPQFLRKLQSRAADLHRTLYMCLGQEDAADLRAPLRASESDELLDRAITEAIARKPKGHEFIIDRRHSGPAVPRHMSVTGG
jgi:cyclic pyranopterin phosphate synthase